MAAYNFQQRFVPPIVTGDKCQTIRPIGTRRHARPGEPIQLYTGMRTSKCQKIVAPDPTCLSVNPIKIDFRCQSDPIIEVAGERLPEKQMRKLAIEDGFTSLEEMGEFFRKLYGGFRDEMLLIRWGANSRG